jgi:menaquinone-dependent protoporphyrinogen oxidase
MTDINLGIFTAELNIGRTWIFSSEPIGDPLKPDETPVDVSEMLPLTGAREHRLFGGRIDKHGLGFGERAILAALRVPEGDFRPRADVIAWAQGILGVVGTELGQAPVAASS